MYSVFIQTNQKQLLGAKLAKYSILSNSSTLKESDVQIMEVESYAEMMNYHGSSYLKKGTSHKWSKNDLQSFTLTRFLPPTLMNFKGRAVVIDPDVFATSGTDLYKLLTMDMRGYAVLACGSEKNKVFKSSVMLLDCEKLLSWEWGKLLKKIFTKSVDYRELMNLQLEPEGSVGALDDCWNHCDTLTEDTKLIHYTKRITQPWKTGLRVDFEYDIKSRYWFVPKPILAKLKSMKGGADNIYLSRYQPNPFVDQEKFFFNLLGKGISEGVITKEYLQECITKKYVRSDIRDIIKV